jgi:hypothetical protein
MDNTMHLDNTPQVQRKPSEGARIISVFDSHGEEDKTACTVLLQPGLLTTLWFQGQSCSTL